MDLLHLPVMLPVHLVHASRPTGLDASISHRFRNGHRLKVMPFVVFIDMSPCTAIGCQHRGLQLERLPEQVLKGISMTLL